MGSHSSETEFAVLFPKNTRNWAFKQFLKTIYPKCNIRVRELKSFTNSTHSALKTYEVRHSQDSTKKAVFDLIDEKYWYKLTCSKETADFIFFKLWRILCSQFDQSFIFDILKYIEEEYYQKYFDAIKALLDRNAGTAALNLGYIAEHFGKVVLQEKIPDSYKGMKGITKIREFVIKHDSWNDLINVIPIIKNTLKLDNIEKENLELLRQGFHFLRLLRNKALHPNPTFTYSHSVTMLSLLIFLPGLIEWILES